eukprot:TRINITY_DN11260_c0_g3_i1.p1 TRINITY_DN11260_c0_g3~~TRINITY_DN11260_c0_g3_i1.p1  ORF type:complete len:791 (+),score=89.14 TRINITY_DN11260_c0_g3_i1:56-2428(+)
MNTMLASPVSPALSPDWIEEELKRIGGSQQVLLDDRLVVGGVKGLLTKSAVQSVPAEVKKQMKSVLMVQLSNLLIPMIRRWIFKRKRLQTKFSEGLKQRAITTLRKAPMMEFWPDALLNRIIDNSYPVTTRPSEIVLYMGETARSGVFSLLHGSVRLIERNSTEILGTLEAPQIFNADSTFVDEPSPYIVKTCTDTVWMSTPQNILIDTIKSSPTDIQEKILTIMNRKRLVNLQNNYKMTPEDLRECTMFSTLSDSQCKMVIDRLTPKILREGEIVLQNKQPKEMFFIKRGDVEMAYPLRTPSLPLEVILKTAGEVVNHSELYYGERNPYLITVKSTSDVWSLSGPDLKELLIDTDISVKVREGAKMSKEAQLLDRSTSSMVNLRLRTCVENTPIIGVNTSSACQEEIVDSLRPRHFTATTVFISTSDPCDALMFIVKGQALVHNSGGLKKSVVINEALGFTCVADHRWTNAVSAASNCDAWVISKEDLTRILRKHNCLSKVQSSVRSLLTNPVPDLNVRHITPALYPTVATGNRSVMRRESSVAKRHSVVELESLLPSVTPGKPGGTTPCLQTRFDTIMDKASRNIPEATWKTPRRTTRASTGSVSLSSPVGSWSGRLFTSPLSVRASSEKKRNSFPPVSPVGPPPPQKPQRFAETPIQREESENEDEKSQSDTNDHSANTLSLTVIPNYRELGKSKAISIPPPSSLSSLRSELLAIFSPDRSMKVSLIQKVQGTELSDLSADSIETGDTLFVTFKVAKGRRMSLKKEKKLRKSSRSFSPFMAYLPKAR